MAEQYKMKMEDVSNVDDVAVDESLEKTQLDLVFTEQETKALLRKIDLHLIPFLSLLYLLSFLE